MARLPVGIVRRGSFYQARWYDAAGRRHRASFDTAAEADAYGQDRLRALTEELEDMALSKAPAPIKPPVNGAFNKGA